MATEAFDVGAPGTEQRDVMFCAPLHVLAEVQLVGLTGQAAVSGQEPGERALLLGCEYLVSNCHGCRRQSDLHRILPTAAGDSFAITLRTP